jgi:hypothetical protein
MKSLSKYSILAALATLAGSTVANATTILESIDFNSPTYANGGLNGQDSWAAHSAAGTNPITVAGNPGNGFVSLTTSGEDDHRNFAPAVTSDSVYLSCDFSLSAASTGDYFIHLGDGGSSLFYDRVFAKSSGTGFVMALGTSAGTTPTYGTTVLDFNTVYHMVARYDFVAGSGNDTGALFINPTDPILGGDNLYVAATTQGTDASSIAGVYLRQGAAASSATVSSVDNIVVAVVPTPASLALLGLGGLVAGRRKR